MKKIILSLVAAFSLMGGLSGAHAAEGGIPWDKFPKDRVTDVAALQNGAKLFVNYCLNCHEAAFMRYNRLRDIGLTEQQIKDNLMFATDKVGDTMKSAIDPRQAKEWLGATPPDLTVIARSRSSHSGTGSDYLYTFLRTYYRDGTKETGWNNLAFPNVGMPHPLWELQGQRAAKYTEQPDVHHPGKTMQVFAGYEQLSKGKLSQQEYDAAVADLVAYLTWMAEPVAAQRVRLGVWVLLFLSLFAFVAWRLNAAFWKDVK